MPLTKPAPSPSHSSRASPSSGHRHSGSGFHPFGGRVSRHFGDSLSPDDAYLSYYDVRLTREDVDCIKDDWLTDNAIAFWEEYLEREKLGSYPKANIVLLRPSMAFLLLKTKDPLSLKSALPSFEKTTHIFLPVNDCRDVDTAEGGSHWSLLLVSVIDGVAFHYDSLSPANMQEAKLIAHRISQLLGKPLKFINLDDSPQQENSMDCGVYVCLLMQHLLISRLLRAHNQDKISMSMRGKEVDASGGRKEMLRIIEARRKEGERRRSRSQSPYHAHNVHGSKSRSPPRIGEENENANKES
ncbi:cysteine proteinase [Hortaea werneckii]|nr:cysteine proteinase [Hortaea werneckii]KAI7102573.1 cysteine proteinase [Hortaea werneckii]KAI7237656.1 cysteine proteinase [Hortaea werneckii]KAI7331268.1 cysteine proteinase [Hortaea werneckii]KAI7336661.1 cysteine proteinase [Hortaea werneckii]